MAPKCKKLEKIVYRFYNNAVKLINAISSNDMEKSKNAFVDPFGKLVLLFDQFIDGNDVYIVFNKKFEQRFLDHMKIYMKFSKTKLEKRDMNVYHVVEGEIGRGIKILQNIGHILLTRENLEENITQEEYDLIRLENNIPEQGIDFDQDMLLNVMSNAFSSTKGCFVGQEVLARVYNLGKPPKKLARITSDKLINNATTQAYSVKYGKYLGFKIINRNDESSLEVL